jgi:hypothetical protein
VVQLVVDNVACCLVVDGIDDLVVAVLLVAAGVFCLSAVACMDLVSSEGEGTCSRV